jgi:primosomal protein N' (replication factor Y)
MPAVARVAVVSNLPQLDRLFDYLIPDELHSEVHVGSRVKVPFGKSSKAFDGFVFELDGVSDYNGQLASVSEVVGTKPSLSRELIELVKELSIRSASSLGEILKLVVPPHMPRAFKKHENTLPSSLPEHLFSIHQQALVQKLILNGSRHAVLAKPGISSGDLLENIARYPHWVQLLCSIARFNLEKGQSSILVVPDYRDLEILLDALVNQGLNDYICNYSQEQTKSQAYEAYLRALDDVPRVVIGSRSAVLAPAFNLGSIVIFDDGDHSLTDQSAPYLNARDSSLIRQSIQACSLVFVSHSRSTDVQRLVESGYLVDSSEEFPRPNVAVSEPGFRVDSHAFKAIKKGLETGSVLVQVASKGESTALFCSACNKRVSCQICSGPIWVDGAGVRKCRWCNGFSQATVCECGSSKISKGRAGASRTAAELGRSFPNSKITESTGESRTLRVSPGRNLVIATAGAEPFVEGGYQAVVLLDAQTLLSKQHLRANEEAIRLWSNAISKLATGGSAVLVGVSGSLSQMFCLWQQVEIASLELASRRELMLPPALRLGSIAGSQALLVELAESLMKFDKVKVLGPAPFSRTGDNAEWRLIVKYNYSDTVEVAKHLRGESIRLSRGKSVVASSGRAVRALKIRMSDGDVI